MTKKPRNMSSAYASDYRERQSFRMSGQHGPICVTRIEINVRARYHAVEQESRSHQSIAHRL